VQISLSPEKNDCILEKMNQISIKNFGPVRKGYTDDAEGLLNINRVTLFIGNQASGKSTVAKLISTCTWLEKALVRGDFSIKWLCQYNRFQHNLCKFQNIQDYFNENTYLLYKGMRYDFLYEHGKFNVKDKGTPFLMPQVMYIPAERNLLSVIEEADRIRNLPQSLFTLLEVYNQARRSLTKSLELPVGGLSLSYDKLNHITWISGKDYKVRLAAASSGLQSLAPLTLVIHYLWQRIQQNTDTEKSQVSVREYERLNKEIEHILAQKNVTEEVRAALLKQIPNIRNEYLFGIVEEPEENLFPESQKSVLYDLLSFIKKGDKNQFIFTTHSPYMLSYITLAEKAYMLLRTAGFTKQEELNKVVPLGAAIDSADVSLYQLTDDGRIELLPNVNGLLEDNNYLNKLMSQTNEDFGTLLDLE